VLVAERAGDVFIERPDAGDAPDGAVTPDAAAGETAPGATGPLVLYLFDEGGGAQVRDRSGVAPALDLDVEATSRVTWLPGAGCASTTSPASARPAVTPPR
jgi:hypothetical protein